jgi:DNA-binding response OmpR family regulator
MKKKILVVDDDQGIRDIFQIIFEREGYEVDVKEDGRDILKNNYILPDIFIIDKQLSGMDGLDICHFLKRQPVTKNIPVVIVSATPDIDLLVEQAGADDYIKKPFELYYLLAVVEKYLSFGKVLHKV